MEVVMTMDMLPDAPVVTPQNLARDRYVEVGQDTDLAVEFYKCATDGRDHVRIQIPGDERTIVDVPATEHYQQRFRRQWEAYASELDQLEGQTRLELVAWVSPGTVGDLKRIGIHTVEQLAAVSDGAIDASKMLGLDSLRERARVEVEQSLKARGHAEISARADAQERELHDLRARLAALEAKPKGEKKPQPST